MDEVGLLKKILSFGDLTILVLGGDEMEESILDTIKTELGLTSDYEVFDKTIISNINTALFVLFQLGIGKDSTRPFSITGRTETWADFVDEEFFQACKDYVYIRVKLLFDPPTNSFLVENLKRQADEFEWRLIAANDEYKARQQSTG